MVFPDGLEDDRESCFYVLVWTALKYSKHHTLEFLFRASSGEISKEDNITEFLRAFDEVYADAAGTLKGGKLKSEFLMSGALHRVVRFDKQPLLDRLVDDLNRVFQVRYIDPPTQEQFDQFTQLQADSFTEAVLQEITVYDFLNRQERLKRRGWLVDTIRSYLTTPDDWPDDKAERQKTVCQTGSKCKMAMDQANLQVDERAPKKHSSGV